MKRSLKDFPPPTFLDTPCRLWQGSTSGGYGTMWRTIEGKRVLLYVHRWVWEQIHGVIQDGMQVLHHCDHKICYRYDHLFLGTQQDNVDDMMVKGRHGFVVHLGELHGCSKLLEEEVLEIRARFDLGESPTEISEDFDVDRTTVSRIGQRKLWRHL